MDAPNVPKIPEAEPISVILGTAPRVVIRIIAGVQDLKKVLRTVHDIGSRLFLSRGIQNCGRRFVLFAALWRRCRVCARRFPRDT